jgi:aspartate/methionine/tyrosine aminotransferase
MDLGGPIDAARCARIHPQQSQQPTGWTATRGTGDDTDMARRRGVWLISDEVYSRLIYDGSPRRAIAAGYRQTTDRVIVQQLLKT